jgi:hypothetical protein
MFVSVTQLAVLPVPSATAKSTAQTASLRGRSIGRTTIRNSAIVGFAVSALVVGNAAAAFADSCSGVQGDAEYLKARIESTVGDINNALYFQRGEDAKAREFADQCGGRGDRSKKCPAIASDLTALKSLRVENQSSVQRATQALTYYRESYQKVNIDLYRCRQQQVASGEPASGPGEPSPPNPDWRQESQDRERLYGPPATAELPPYDPGVDLRPPNQVGDPSPVRGPSRLNAPPTPLSRTTDLAGQGLPADPGLAALQNAISSSLVNDLCDWVGSQTNTVDLDARRQVISEMYNNAETAVLLRKPGLQAKRQEAQSLAATVSANLAAHQRDPRLQTLVPMDQEDLAQRRQQAEKAAADIEELDALERLMRIRIAAAQGCLGARLSELNQNAGQQARNREAAAEPDLPTPEEEATKKAIDALTQQLLAQALRDRDRERLGLPAEPVQPQAPKPKTAAVPPPANKTAPATLPRTAALPPQALPNQPASSTQPPVAGPPLTNVKYLCTSNRSPEMPTPHLICSYSSLMGMDSTCAPGTEGKPNCPPWMAASDTMMCDSVQAGPDGVLPAGSKGNLMKPETCHPVKCSSFEPGKTQCAPVAAAHKDVMNAPPAPAPKVAVLPPVAVVPASRVVPAPPAHAAPTPLPPVALSPPVALAPVALALAVLPPPVIVAPPHVNVLEPATPPLHVNVYTPPGSREAAVPPEEEPEAEQPPARQRAHPAKPRTRVASHSRSAPRSEPATQPRDNGEDAAAIGALIGIIGGALLSGQGGGGGGGYSAPSMGHHHNY